MSQNTTISQKVERYKNYQDDDEMHLFYYYCGMKALVETGYNEQFAELLQENLEIPNVNSYWQGYSAG